MGKSYSSDLRDRVVAIGPFARSRGRYRPPRRPSSTFAPISMPTKPMRTGNGVFYAGAGSGRSPATACERGLVCIETIADRPISKSARMPALLSTTSSFEYPSTFTRVGSEKSETESRLRHCEMEAYASNSNKRDLASNVKRTRSTRRDARRAPRWSRGNNRQSLADGRR